MPELCSVAAPAILLCSAQAARLAGAGISPDAASSRWISTTAPFNGSWLSRFSIMSTYVGSISIPMEFRPASIAARFVVAVPANGSSTMSPARRTSGSIGRRVASGRAPDACGCSRH